MWDNGAKLNEFRGASMLDAPQGQHQYCHLSLCFNPRRNRRFNQPSDKGTSGLQRWHRNSHIGTDSENFFIASAQSQTSRLGEPDMRGIVKRQASRTRKIPDTPSVNFVHCFDKKLLGVRVKGLHVQRIEKTGAHILGQGTTEFIPPETNRDPIGILTQERVSSLFQREVRRPKIGQNSGINNNHEVYPVGKLGMDKIVIPLITLKSSFSNPVIDLLRCQKPRHALPQLIRLRNQSLCTYLLFFHLICFRSTILSRLCQISNCLLIHTATMQLRPTFERIVDHFRNASDGKCLHSVIKMTA